MGGLVGRAFLLSVLALAAACAHPRGGQEAAEGDASSAKACAACHGPSLALERTRRSVHAAVRDDAACDRCHDPHTTPTTAPLTSPEPRLCNGCHGERPFMRPHASGRGDVACTRCHDAHASDEPALLRTPPGKLCGGRHADTMAQPARYPMGPSRCTACHEVHGGRAKLLPAKVHEVATDCGSCHAAATSP